MKRLLALLLAVAMIFCLASCGKKKTVAGDDSGAVETEIGKDIAVDGTDTASSGVTGPADTTKKAASGPEIDVIASEITTNVEGKPVKPEPKSFDAKATEKSDWENFDDSQTYGTDIARENVDGNFVIEPKNDEYTITWTMGNITHVVVHDGEEILSYTTYTDYFDEDVAEEEYKREVANGPELGDYVCLLSRKGTYIIIGYETWGIPFKTPAEAQAAADEAAKLTAQFKAETNK